MLYLLHLLLEVLSQHHYRDSLPSSLCRRCALLFVCRHPLQVENAPKTICSVQEEQYPSPLSPTPALRLLRPPLPLLLLLSISILRGLTPPTPLFLLSLNNSVPVSIWE
jgi:hypothetical protein